MKIVTVLCGGCSNYFRMEAFEPADLLSPLCYDCREECAHEDVRIERFDAGRCTETGYQDDGEVAVCRACGHREVA